jgi:hypothetical protein
MFNLVWALYCKAAACFKTIFWALSEAVKAKQHTVGYRITVSMKLDPLVLPLLLDLFCKSASTRFSMAKGVLYVEQWCEAGCKHVQY